MQWMPKNRFFCLLFGLTLSLGGSGCGDDAEPEAIASGCDIDFGTLSAQVQRTPDAEDGCDWRVSPGASDQQAIQTALIEAVAGETVCLEAGTFKLSRELRIAEPHLTLRGAGKFDTVLDFAGQLTGANGLAISSDGVTVQSLEVRDTAGDAIRATAVHNITFDDVSVLWSADESKDNGAYGLYPVQCDGVVIRGCTVKGASDAGVYVGQSFRILVEGNEVFGNVAGIEIENSVDAEVVGNHAHDNTGGILVFNLPNIPLRDGRRAKVHDNLVENNNGANFAPVGNIVGSVPSGSGIIVLAADDNEFYDNIIKGNQSLGIGLVYYDKDVFGSHDDELFDPFCQGNYVHDNTLENNGYSPQGVMILIQEPTIAPLAWAGCVDPDVTDTEGARNCFENNGDATYLDFDLCGGFTDKTTDIAEVTCSHAALDIPEPCSESLGCTTPPVPVRPPATAAGEACGLPYPNLSDYGLFTGAPSDQVGDAGVVAYDVAAPLFSDSTGKRRFMVLPGGKKAAWTDEGPLEFPVGTTLVKTFAEPSDTGLGKLIETRLLIHEDSGWTGHVYRWSDDQTDARRTVAGETITLTGGQQYIVPNTPMCADCHTQNDSMVPLGPSAMQLHNQVADLTSDGHLTGTPADLSTVKALPSPYGSDGTLEDRARAWLHTNCAHCHRKGGLAGSTGLLLEAQVTDDVKYGICKTPVAAGAGSGGLKYDIVPGNPDASILVHRIESTDPAVKMPEVPNLTVDAAGIAVVREWIQSMPALDCDAE
ncbi:MAG: parallel beta-helix repeat protein [Myxococcota bacterium]|jgi:parallel beta-helix repeat protein